MWEMAEYCLDAVVDEIVYLSEKYQSDPEYKSLVDSMPEELNDWSHINELMNWEDKNRWIILKTKDYK